MNEEHSYEALYLYNAVIEYVYFVISLIEAEGPRSLIDVEKHLKFFNYDIYGFAKIFKGEDLAEKIGTMVCTTTQIFTIKEKTLNLALNYERFKRTIYKDLLLSKLVDAILRGIYCIKDLCHYLNLNNIIKIDVKSLTVILKKYPNFYIDSNNTVIMVQFHGLLGFEDHPYKTVFQYFQSYLQNINSLTCNEVISHEKLIPSCAVSNPLFLICVLHVCSIFKCEDGKVKLRKKFRTKNCGNQIINLEELDINLSESIPIGLLVSKGLGKTLYCWIGEISELKKSTGLIQCVVNFSNGYQGIFVIYMYKTALKYICETENLSDYLSIRDVVEFDAIYSDEGVNQGIYWQATRIKVIKQSLKKNKFELDVDVGKYFENVKLNGNLFNLTSKTCNLRSCNASFPVLEKKTSTKFQKKANAKLSSDLDTNLSSNLQSIVFKKASKLHQNSSDCILNETVSIPDQFLPLRDSREESLYDFKIVHNINSSAVKTDFNKNNAHISDLLFLHSTFVFGEVSMTSKDDGIATTKNELQQYNVFFKSEAIFSENTKRIPAKGNLVLLFIPYFKKEESFCVATLVYPLNSEESILFKENISIENFVLNNFLPTVIKSLGDIYPCFCSLRHILTQILRISPKIETEREKISKCVDFIKNLLEPFCFSKKTITQFFMLINELYSQNLGYSYKRLCADLRIIFLKAFSYISCSKKFTVLFKGKKTTYKYIHKRNHSSFHFMSYLNTTFSKMPDIVISSFYKEKNISMYDGSDNEKEILIKSKESSIIEKADVRFNFNSLQVEQSHGSFSSLNSNKSYNSKSSDEHYYSCESLSEVFDSDTDKKENSLLNETNNTDLHEDNDYKNPSTDFNGLKDSPILAEKSPETFNEAIDIPEITLNSLSKKCTQIFKVTDFSNFKLRHYSLTKAKIKRNRRRVILPSTRNHCKNCCKPMIETTACVTTITKSCLYFSADYNQQIASLRYPKYLVSEEILKNLSSESTVKIGLIPNTLLHFADVLYVNLL